MTPESKKETSSRKKRPRGSEGPKRTRVYGAGQPGLSWLLQKGCFCDENKSQYRNVWSKREEGTFPRSGGGGVAFVKCGGVIKVEDQCVQSHPLGLPLTREAGVNNRLLLGHFIHPKSR